MLINAHTCSCLWCAPCFARFLSVRTSWGCLSWVPGELSFIPATSAFLIFSYSLPLQYNYDFTAWEIQDLGCDNAQGLKSRNEVSWDLLVMHLAVVMVMLKPTASHWSLTYRYLRGSPWAMQWSLRMPAKSVAGCLIASPVHCIFLIIYLLPGRSFPLETSLIHVFMNVNVNEVYTKSSPVTSQ